MAHSLKSVRRLLQDKPTLKSLEREVNAQGALLGEVRRLLPVDLAAHCLAARIRGPQIILHADSPVWATRLRFVSNGLLSLLQSDHPVLREIRVRLMPARGAPPRRRAAARRSEAGAVAVLESAQHTADTALREALQRLGRSLQGRKS